MSPSTIPEPPTSAPPPESVPLGRELAAARDRLQKQRARARTGIWIETIGIIALLLVAYAVPTLLTDRFLRLEWIFRAALLVSFLVVVARIVRRRLMTSLDVHLTDEEMALAVERKSPELEQLLISSLQFDREIGVATKSIESQEMKAAVVASVRELLRDSRAVAVDEDTELRLASAQCVLDTFHRFHRTRGRLDGNAVRCWVVPSQSSRSAKRHVGVAGCPWLVRCHRRRDERLFVSEVLGQHVVQVIADRDEVEALVKELRHTISAELEHTKQDVLLGCALDQLVRGCLQLRALVHVREVILAIEQPHRHAQIVLTKEQKIDARHSTDLLHVRDAISSLDLQGDQNVVVVAASVPQQTLLVHRALREVHRARASLAERIQAARDASRSLLRVVDVRDQDAVRTEVQRLLDAVAIVVPSHTHHRLGATVLDGTEHR